MESSDWIRFTEIANMIPAGPRPNRTRSGSSSACSDGKQADAAAQLQQGGPELRDRHGNLTHFAVPTRRWPTLRYKRRSAPHSWRRMRQRRWCGSSGWRWSRRGSRRWGWAAAATAPPSWVRPRRPRPHSQSLGQPPLEGGPCRSAHRRARAALDERPGRWVWGSRGADGRATEAHAATPSPCKTRSTTRPTRS